MDYFITNNFTEIIAGTDNKASFEYMEASKTLNKDDNGVAIFIQRFLKNIEKIARGKKATDRRIAESRGNIKKFAAYEKMMNAMEWINKNIPGVELMKDLKIIYDKLVEYQSFYEKAYDKQIKLVIYEYENSVYMLVSGLSLILANSIDFEMERYSLKINRKKNAITNKVSVKIIEDLATQLSHHKHKDYLDAMIKAVDIKGVDTDISESTYIESVVSDTVDLIFAIRDNIGSITKSGVRLISTVKNSIFGIIPLIRSILYLRYKRKADIVLNLEQQIDDIEKNIEQLKNIKDMDKDKKEEIIKKQKVIIYQYKKRAEKIKTELLVGEKEASEELKVSNNVDIKNAKDDDFVLEGSYISDIFKNE